MLFRALQHVHYTAQFLFLQKIAEASCCVLWMQLGTLSRFECPQVRVWMMIRIVYWNLMVRERQLDDASPWTNDCCINKASNHDNLAADCSDIVIGNGSISIILFNRKVPKHSCVQHYFWFKACRCFSGGNLHSANGSKSLRVNRRTFPTFVELSDMVTIPGQPADKYM